MSEALFATEEKLCTAFLGLIPKGWIAYPECEGWDILLVRSDGVQVGIQAKLRLNAKVLCQAAETGYFYRVASRGPDYRAVLVPADKAPQEMETIARRIGVTVITVHRSVGSAWAKRGEKWSFRPDLPRLEDKDRDYSIGESWEPCMTLERHPIPEYVPDVAAGASAPLKLTGWKVKAIKIAIILERRGYVDRSDFKTINIDHRRWIDGGWIIPASDVVGWKAGPTLPDFKRIHPRNYEEIAADAEKWMPPHQPVLVPAQLEIGGQA